MRKLPRSKKKIIRRVLKDYQRAQDEEYKQLYRDVYCRLFEYPVRIFKIFTKGAAIGMSVAGIVNTIAPNLFPTALGYIAGSMSMNILVKIGMVSVGVFSPPVFTRGAILYIGAAVGAVIYAIFKLGFICVRGTYRLAKRPSKIPKGARGT